MKYWHCKNVSGKRSGIVRDYLLRGRSDTPDEVTLEFDSTHPPSIVWGHRGIYPIELWDRLIERMTPISEEKATKMFLEVWRLKDHPDGT